MKFFESILEWNHSKWILFNTKFFLFYFTFETFLSLEFLFFIFQLFLFILFRLKKHYCSIFFFLLISKKMFSLISKIIFLFPATTDFACFFGPQEIYNKETKKEKKKESNNFFIFFLKKNFFPQNLMTRMIFQKK